MIAQNFINHELPVLRPSDTVHTALDFLREYHVEELAVAKDDKYLGLVFEKFLINLPDPEVLLAEVETDKKELFVAPGKHIFDAIKIAFSHEVKVVPVVDGAGSFMGCININDALSDFARLTSILDSGGILNLSVSKRDYSMFEISKIAEENETKILGSFISQDPHLPGNMIVTLKFNRVDLAPLVAAFTRYNYRISGVFQEKELVSKEHEHLESLIKYLEI